jgi:hypothetical protein
MPKLKKQEHDAGMQLVANRDTGGRIECIYKSVQHSDFPCRGEIMLHHDDNNPLHNPKDGSNHTNLCRGHNARRDARGLQYNARFQSFKKLKQYMEETGRGKPAEMLKGEEAEAFFRIYALEALRSHQELSVEDLIDSAKEAFNKKTKKTISQKALFGYYKSMRNPVNGSLEEFTKGEDGESWVRLRRIP